MSKTRGNIRQPFSYPYQKCTNGVTIVLVSTAHQCLQFWKDDKFVFAKSREEVDDIGIVKLVEQAGGKAQ